MFFLAYAQWCCRWRARRYSVPRQPPPATATSTACGLWAVGNRPTRSTSPRLPRQRCVAWPRPANACGPARPRAGANPTRQLSLQPEAPGADQEATNGLKHFGKRSLLGISGPCGPQHKPTLTRPRKDQCESRPASGTGRSPSSGKRARYAPDGLTGVKVAARMAEHQCATREVCLGDQGRQPDGQRRTREGQRRPGQMADGSVLLWTPGNAGRGKGP